MAKLHESYPGIAKATLEIAYDNGGINRDRPEKQQQSDLDRFLVKCGIEPSELTAIDQWLAGLSEEQLNTVCCGEHNEQQELIKQGPPWVDHLLTKYFDEVC